MTEALVGFLLVFVLLLFGTPVAFGMIKLADPLESLFRAQLALDLKKPFSASSKSPVSWRGI